jgi:hypothetical protein
MLSRVMANRKSSTPTRAQFTGAAFTGVLAGNRIAISMDGKFIHLIEKRSRQPNGDDAIRTMLNRGPTAPE